MSSTPFTDIPVRANGTRITAQWWNLLRLAGIYFETVIGTGTIPDTQQTVTDNSAYTNVTGFSLSSASFSAGRFEFVSYRNNGTVERTHTHIISARYNSKITAWQYTWSEEGEECSATVASSAPSGIEFEVTSAGQLRVKCNNALSGSPTNKIRGSLVKTWGVYT